MSAFDEVARTEQTVLIRDGENWIHCDLFVSICHCRVERKSCSIRQVKRYWEIIADNLSQAGWSWGCVSAIDTHGRTTWIVDAHRDDGRRLIVRAKFADELSV